MCHGSDQLGAGDTDRRGAGRRPIITGAARRSLGGQHDQRLTRRPTIVAAAAALVAVCALLVRRRCRPGVGGDLLESVNPPLPANAVAGQGMTYVVDVVPGGRVVRRGRQLPRLSRERRTTSRTDHGRIGQHVDAPSSHRSRQRRGRPPGVPAIGVVSRGAGTCVAVGRYLDTSGATQGLVDATVATVCGRRPRSALPAGPHRRLGAYAQLAAVAAPRRSCTAAGLYSPSAGAEQASSTPRSTGAGPRRRPLSVGPHGVAVHRLACPAGLVHGDGHVRGQRDLPGFVELLTGGVWTAAALPVPAGTSSHGVDRQQRPVGGVPHATDCVVAGTTFDGNYEGLSTRCRAGRGDGHGGRLRTARPPPTCN